MMHSPHTLPYLLILTAGVLWGGTFSLALIATSEGVHPLMLTAWQVLLTAAIATVVCITQKVPPFRLCNIGMYLAVGSMGVILPDILYYNAAPHLSAGVLSITVSTVPVFTYVIMWLLRLEGFETKRVLGIVLGMMAILLLVIPDQGFSSESANFWTLVVITCAVLYACENVYISEVVGNTMSVFEILSGSTIVSSIFLIPAVYFYGVTEPLSWIVSKSGWAISATAAISVIAYSIFFYTIKVAGPVFASQCAYIVTIAGVLWGLLIFSEQHTIWIWASVVVLMIGVALVSPKNTANTATAQGQH